MKAQVLSGISKVANEIKKDDVVMSSDLENIIKHLSTILPEDKIEKEAKLINEGDIVVCCDNFQPLFKGRKYLVADSSIPGYLAVNELDGTNVGVFAVNRFLIDWNGQ